MVTTDKTQVIWIALTLTVSGVASQLIPSVCKNVPVNAGGNGTNRRPNLNNQFRVDVECKLSERNSTTYVREYYDLPNNRGRMTMKKSKGSMEFYMDYTKNLLMVVIPDKRECDAGLLPLTEDKFVFGYKFNGISSQILSPSGALHFSSANETYAGVSQIRSIYVDEWHSCQYIDALNATAHVIWYFSRKENWDMQIGLGSSPIRMMAAGKQGMPDGSVKSFSHTYDFFNFLNGVNPKDFEVADGIYCPGREIVERDKTFPKVPDNFYFVMEVNNPYDKVHSIVEEAYDHIAKLAVYKFNSKFVNMPGTHRYTELNDYTTGVTYLVDRDDGSCEVMPVEAGPFAFSKQVDNRTVRMETPREFFMEKNIKYQYAGRGHVRNMDCDRWIGITDQARGTEGINVTVEWFFATTGWQVEHENWDTSLYRIPLLLRIAPVDANVSTLPYEFNIFHYSVNYFLHEVDLSPCFTMAERKTLRFSIPGSNATDVRLNILQTTVAIQQSFATAAGISPLRISDVNFYFDPDKVWVIFDLLDNSPLFGGVVGFIHENSLDDAYKFIRYDFNNAIVKFSVVSGTVMREITPNYDSLEDLTQSSQQTQNSDKYSAGAFAGLTVAMLIVGGGGGSFGTFLVLSRR